MKLDKWYSWQYRHSLSGALVWALQQALKGYGITHPDPKRQRSRKLLNKSYAEARAIKSMRGQSI